MKKIFSLLFFICLSISVNAQANKNDVKVFLEVSGLTTKYKMVVEQFSEQLPEDLRADFQKDVQVFIDKQIAIETNKYAAAFSQDEILKLIEFYKSPLGIKFVNKTNEINIFMQEEFETNQTELQGIIMKYFM